jgi:hypothetical protein
VTIELSPVRQLFLLTGLAVVARPLFVRVAVVPAAAGAVVMAVGIFGLAALQQMPSAKAMLTQPLAIALLVVWGLLAVAYAASYLTGTFREYTRRPLGGFAIGCWVAGTAVVLQLILKGVPEWRPLSLALGLLAFALWLWFLKVIAAELRAVTRLGSRDLVPGVVLLSTVSTQSLVIAALDLFPNWRWLPLAEGSIAFGMTMYVAGVALMAWSHIRARGWTLADDWDNTNCILHGAMSITGLAVVDWGIAPPLVAVGLWLYVFAVFIAVEAVEIARLLTRVRAYGWRRGAFSYRVSQWSRNFTFGMFFAFTLAFSHRIALPADLSWVRVLQEPVLTLGPYLVLALLLIELGLFVESSLDRRPITWLLNRMALRSRLWRRD